MNIKCNTKELTSNIQIAAAAVAAKPVTTALGGLCLIAQGKYLKINGMASNLTISTVMEADVTEEGRILVPARLLNALMRKLTGPETILNAPQGCNMVNIENEKSKSSLPLMNIDAFPPLLTADKNKMISVPGGDIKDLITKSVYAVSTDESRPIFTGVLANVENNRIQFVGTNTHRIATKYKCLNTNSESYTVTIPAKILRELAKVLTDKEEEVVRMAMGDRTVMFQTKTLQIIGAVIEGKFPDIKRVIPPSYKSEAKIPRKELIEALERIRLFTSDNENNIIKFIFEDKKLEVGTQQKELGSSTEEICCELQGEPIKIAFNSVYVIECLKTMSSDHVYIKMNSSLSPTSFLAEGEEDYLNIITPIRIVF